MSWDNVRIAILNITHSFFISADKHYHMITDNALILCFVLMCCIFIGLSLLKRLIHIK